MPYVSAQDLIDRFGEIELVQLTDRLNTGVIDEDVLDRAIRDADAEIDSYLSRRYQTPVLAVAPVLQLHAANIARYRLYDDDSTDEVDTRYKQAVRWLTAIRDGAADLPGATPSTTGGSVASADRSMVFTDSTFATMPGATS